MSNFDPADDRFLAMQIIVPEPTSAQWELAGTDDEVETTLYTALKRIWLLLGRIAWNSTTPEKIAWLSIWSRFCEVIKAARALRECSSLLGIRSLERIAFETGTQLQAILLPVIGHVDRRGPIPESAWPKVRERFCVYLAWLLYGDEMSLTGLLNEDLLAHAFDRRPHFMRDFAATFGGETYRQVFGRELEVLSESEAAFDKHRAKTRAARELMRVKELQADYRLRATRRVIERVAGNRPEKPLRPVDLFQLLEQTEGRGAFRRFLAKRGLPHAHFDYFRSSQTLHGSALTPALSVVTGAVAPRFMITEADETDELVVDIAGTCNAHWLLLSLAADHIDS